MRSETRRSRAVLRGRRWNAETISRWFLRVISCSRFRCEGICVTEHGHREQDQFLEEKRKGSRKVGLLTLSVLMRQKPQHSCHTFEKEQSTNVTIKSFICRDCILTLKLEYKLKLIAISPYRCRINSTLNRSSNGTIITLSFQRCVLSSHGCWYI